MPSSLSGQQGWSASTKTKLGYHNWYVNSIHLPYIVSETPTTANNLNPKVDTPRFAATDAAAALQ